MTAGARPEAQMPPPRRVVVACPASGLFEGGGIVTHDPAVVGVGVFHGVGSPAQNDLARCDDQPGPLMLKAGIELQPPIVGGDADRTAGFVGTGGQIQRVQSLQVTPLFQGAGHQIQCPAGPVDDRGAFDPHVAADVAIGGSRHHRNRADGGSRVSQVALPEQAVFTG